MITAENNVFTIRCKIRSPVCLSKISDLLCIFSISTIGIFAQNHFETDKKDLQFESNGIQLSGVLISPKTDKKAPLLIIVPNSWSPRFVSIAEYFATNGIA